MEIKKIRENIYEIPKEGGMNVPTRIFASEKLLEKMKDDKSLEQAKNIAHFPGIHKYSIALPDAHQGYGMPIGGVVALDSQKGAISPGAVGFDINCLSGDSEVLLSFGRHRKIKELEKDFEKEKATLTIDKTTTSDIQLFTKKNDQKIFELETETGENIKATKDHPFLTYNGMKELGDLSEGDQIFIRPFRGLPDEDPEEFVVLTEEDFKDENQQLIKALKERDILPLKSTDKEFNILLKLVGFHTGDGSFNNDGQTNFYAEKEDLEEIREDIGKIGFKPSPIYSRKRNHDYKGNKFERTEHMVRSTSKAFERLIQKLGAPRGKKTSVEFTIPDYLDRLSGWQQALYLSGFFGAEMSSPKAQHDKDFYCPKISQNKSYEIKKSGEKFMRDIKKKLKNLGINTNEIESFEVGKNQDGRGMRFRLGLKNDINNLINFFTKIGYRYNLEKQKKAVKAVQYLKAKKISIQRRDRIASKCVELYEKGEKPKDIKQKFEINDRFIERSIYSGRKTRSRPPQSFPTFEEYSKNLKVKDNITIKTSIKSIEEAGKGPVYDIGIDHPAHNFISNGFVVSNCGVRVIKTNLKYKDIKNKKKQLLNILFNKVPLGLGKGKTVDVSKSDFREIMDKGMNWALENGYAVEEDLEHCEENGSMNGDHSKISQKAINRGMNQVGSLGSGNHFLEVQRVEEVYDQETAEKFGLEEDQVTITIHTGSRGFGHQVCSDYLKKTEKEYRNIVDKMPDKELAYAPAQDELAQDYHKAMKCASNFAWNNRQMITYNVRDCFSTIFDKNWQELGMDLLYDVAHNIAKLEEHEINGEKKKVYVHRKGATRSFAPGRKEVPESYRETGQPVIIPGSMGTGTYILKGTEEAMNLTFGSTAHGAGRLMSRSGAKSKFWGEDVQNELKRDNILVKSRSGGSGIAEEAPGAYKDVDEVVKISDELGIGQKVAKLVPIVNVKG